MLLQTTKCNYMNYLWVIFTSAKVYHSCIYCSWNTSKIFPAKTHVQSCKRCLSAFLESWHPWINKLTHMVLLPVFFADFFTMNRVQSNQVNNQRHRYRLLQKLIFIADALGRNTCIYGPRAACRVSSLHCAQWDVSFAELYFVHLVHRLSNWCLKISFAKGTTKNKNYFQKKKTLQ